MTEDDRQKFTEMLRLCAEAVESKQEDERKEAICRLEEKQKERLMKNITRPVCESSSKGGKSISKRTADLASSQESTRDSKNAGRDLG